MPELVLFTGGLITAISLYLIARPTSAIAMVDEVFASAWLYGAALLRLLLGAALIGSAHTVSFSTAVEVFGWLFCIGGLTLVTVHRSALQRMAGWFAELSPAMTRLWLSTALLFGLFFIYAYLA